jgi:hypothetical protein
MMGGGVRAQKRRPRQGHGLTHKFVITCGVHQSQRLALFLASWPHQLALSQLPSMLRGEMHLVLGPSCLQSPSPTSVYLGHIPMPNLR